MSETFELRRDAAVAIHRQGRTAEARRAYEALLAERPDDGDVRGLLALAVEAAGDRARAEALLREAIAGRAEPAIALRNINNLLAMLIEAGRRDEAAALVAGPLPAWPAGRKPDAVETRTLKSLAAALAGLDRRDAVLGVIDAALPHFRGDAEIAPLAAALLLGAGRTAEARDLLDAAPGEGPADGSLQALRAAAAAAAGDFGRARDEIGRFVARAPILALKPQPGQTLTIAVLHITPLGLEPDATPHTLHFSGNYPSQLAARRADRFRFVSVFADAPGILGRPLPVRPDLVVNNAANAELLAMGGRVDVVAAVADSYGAPVVNHPRRVVLGTRQRNAERLRTIPGVIAPGVRRYYSQAADRDIVLGEIERAFGYPVILRSVFEHMGYGTVLAEDRARARQALEGFDGQEFYAIEYAPVPHPQGLHRQLRIGFVAGAPFLLRCDWNDGWNVRARRHAHVRAFYRERPDLLADADRIVENPNSVLGPEQLRILDRIARTVGLDIFGLDCDVTEGGRILVYEANAAMNLLSTAPPDMPHPPEPERRFVEAVETLFRTRAARPPLH